MASDPDPKTKCIYSIQQLKAITEILDRRSEKNESRRPKMGRERSAECDYREGIDLDLFFKGIGVVVPIHGLSALLEKK